MRLAASIALLFVSSNAFALSCLWGIGDVNVSPDVEAPQNTRLFVSHTYAADAELNLVLEDVEGERVETTLERGHNYAYITPTADLPPGDYLLRDLDELGYFQGEFTIGDTVDETPPAAPTIVSAQRESSVTEWGDSEGLQVDLEPVDGASHYEFEVSTTADFADAFRVGRRYEGIFIGRGLCDVTFPDYDASKRYYVRARSVDAAGNTSDWTATDGTVRGCSQLGAAPFAWGAPLSLLLLGLRRRNA